MNRNRRASPEGINKHTSGKPRKKDGAKSVSQHNGWECANGRASDATRDLRPELSDGCKIRIDYRFLLEPITWLENSNHFYSTGGWRGVGTPEQMDKENPQLASCVCLH